MTAVALTDEDVLSGALHLYNRCFATRSASGEPIKPIIGCDLSIDTSWLGPSTHSDECDPFARIVLIALNADGMRQVIRLSTQTCRNGRDRPVPLTRDELEASADNLLLLTGGIDGVLARLVRGSSPDAPHRFLEWATGVYGADRLFVELVRHEGSGSDVAGERLLELAHHHRLPPVATNETFYPNADDAFAHTVLQFIRESRSRGDQDRRRPSAGEFYIKSHDEMSELFSDVPEAIENTARIAAMVDPDLRLPRPSFPKGAIPTPRSDSTDYLRNLVLSGLNERFGRVDPEVHERAEHELHCISSSGFTDALLMYAAIASYARGEGILVGPGRGAAAGSLVAYALGITDVDPIRHGLLFERFLSPDRSASPRIEMDFASDRRVEVIEYLQSHWGHDRVARIATFATLKARNAVRQVGAALGLSFDTVNRVVSLIPRELRITLPKARNRRPELDRLSQQDELHRSLFTVAERLEGQVHRVSTHGAGIALSAFPLLQRVPLFRLPGESMPVTQYDSGSLERAGVIRVDILGLRDLAVISRAEELIRETAPTFTLSQIPDGDSATLRLFCEGKTTGVFQFESSGMRELLVRTRPATFEDLCALNALYRPGCFELFDHFVAAGEERPGGTQPSRPFDRILAETNGALLYQEQFIRIVAEVAGLSLAEADRMRRALRRGTAAEDTPWAGDFIHAAWQNGLSQDEATSILELLRAAAPRLVLKAHVVAYTSIAYQSSYLKAHHPREFFAALLGAHIENPSRLDEYIEDASRLDVAVEDQRGPAGASRVELKHDEIVIR
jgi:DNA polymerase-3 subunit alpha